MQRCIRVLSLTILLFLPACASAPRVELREAVADAAEGGRGWKQMTPRFGDERFWVAERPFITNADIARAHITGDNLDRRAVMLEFNEAGQAKMLAHTSAHIGQPVAVLVDGELIAAPRLMSPLRARAMITGLTDQEADRIVNAFDKRAAEAAGP